MAWYEIFIVSVGLSLDVFTYALYKGAMLSRLDKKQILKMILLFTGWQSGAMLLGSLISELPYIAMNYQRTERLFRAASAVIFFPDRDMADRRAYICGTRWNEGKMPSPGDSYAFGPCLPVWTVF